MYRYELNIEWSTPIFPDQSDHPDILIPVTRNFYEWIILGRVRWAGDALVVEIGLLGLRLQLRLDKPWNTRKD